MKTIDMNNIEFSPIYDGAIGLTKEKTCVYPALEPVINKLAALNPLWIFKITNVERFDRDNYRATAFKVYQDGEELGVIRKFIEKQDSVTVEISNDRIGKGMVRRNGYRTQNANKAILKAKKMFAKQNVKELIEKALETAGNVVGNQVFERNRKISLSKDYIHQHAVAYVMNEGYQLFLEFVKTTYPQSEQTKFYVSMEQGQTAEVEMLTIEKVKDKLGTDKTALIIKDGGKYVVKLGSDVQMYDDTTLPENLRAKLGMLKLVEKEHFISNVGCRVSDEVFVLIVEPNIVSQ